jgi:methylglutaconyl-CoA hydratase
LSGYGKSFCAGADLTWMKKTKDYSFEQNISDSKKLGKMFHVLDNLPQAVIGRINGSAIGGGTGLVSICDISVSIENAKFGFSEVNLGLSPAVISPFVINKIGIKNAREFFLTGERFSAKKAMELGLINHLVSDEHELDKKISFLINQIYSSGPQAVNESKKLINYINSKNMDLILEKTSELIAKLRTSNEGQEGISAFLEKRKPYWYKTLEK